MRDYAKVSPQFWSGKTGKALKAQGPEAVIVALYLMTCQHANMIGLYYLSKTYVAVDTGIPLEGASKGLQRAVEAGFCKYDDETEIVWVPEMAAYQIGDQLDAKDNRCKGIQREYDALPENPFLTAFYERYGAAFCMSSCRGKAKGLRSPFKAPTKPRAGARTGEGAETGKEVCAPEARELSISELVAEGVDQGIAETWMKVRAKKKAPLTVLALDGVKREALAAGLSLNDAIRAAAEMNWQGFKASWLGNIPSGAAEPAWRREQRERNEAFLGPAAARRARQPEVIDGYVSEVD